MHLNICMHSGQSVRKFNKFLFIIDILHVMGAVSQDYWHVYESLFTKGYALDVLAS